MFITLIVGLIALCCPAVIIIIPFLGLMLLFTSLPFMMLDAEAETAIILGIIALIVISVYSFSKDS